MKTLTLCLAILSGTFSLWSQSNQTWQGFPEAKVTVRVVGEDGKPILGVAASFVFGGKYDYVHTLVKVTGETDTRGLFTAEGYTYGSFGASLKKSGYYPSSPSIPIFYNSTNGQWLPWNETYNTVLRPIGMPVALCAKTVRLQLPALDEPFGFDLEASDWVAPYGKGMNKDFIFTIHEKWNGNYDFDLQGELSFKNPLDGLQEFLISDIGKNSALKWERLAPEIGYNSKQALRDAWFPDGLGKKPIRSFKKETEWEGYFFRVRTVEQDGIIVSAHYGKIRGGIEVYPDSKTGKPHIVFTYYFNPTPNDRNLEWDTKKNLFGGLTDMETPREP
jgi:hypothetical protein